MPSSQQSSSKTPSPWGNQPRYGEYEIVGARENRPRLLGEGSFGKTFEAVRIDTIAGAEIKEHVAVKVLNPALLKGESKRFQFIQELLALSKFKHSNLIHYIRCGEEHGEVYYAMELCRGGDLTRLVRRYGALPEKVAGLIGLQVATGLREVHQRHRLVHRDIKPSNIMLVDELEREVERRHLGYRFEQQDSLCRVVDFGLVNFTLDAAETSDQQFVGSPMYASPEQIREQPVDGRSDIYSLGMTLWYLVQGKGPLLDAEGEEIREMAEVLGRHTSPEDFAAEFPEHLSAEFRDLLGRMVAKRPDKRFASAMELQSALRQYLSTASEQAETQFAVTRIAQPLDAVYELGPRIPSHNLHTSYAAKEKSGGRQVRLSVVANVEGEGSAAETGEVAGRLCKLAELSQQPSLPEALMPVRSVVWAADLLAYTEEMFPHLALSDVLKARANARRPIGFAEAVSILRPVAEALDFLLQHGQETVSLPCEEVWLTGPAVGSLPLNTQMLTTPLDEWNGLQVRFSMMYVPPAPDAGAEDSAAALGRTMSGSQQMSAADLHPVPVFARLVYRIINGSEVAAAVQFTPYAYVAAVTLGHASNNLLRDILSQGRPWTSALSILKELCANEGVVLHSRATLAVAEVIAPGVVRSPYSLAGATQQLSPEQWVPGGEFICTESGHPVALPLDLPPVRESTPPLPAPDPPRRAASAPPRLGSTGLGDRKTFAGEMRKLQTGRDQSARRPASQPSPTASTPPPLRDSVPTPPPLPSSPPRPSSAIRWLVWIALAGAALVLLLVGVGWLAWRFSSAGVSPPAPPIDPAALFRGRDAGESKAIAGMTFHWCPPTGAEGFAMGSPETETGHAKGETLHQVVLTHGFWTAETELTQGVWQEVMGTTVRTQVWKMLSDDAPYNLGGKQQTFRDAMHLKVGEEERLLGNEGSEMPMYWVNWEDAAEFCRRLTEREHGAGRLPSGWEIRLPTEAQWEYACRAGTRTATHAGDPEIKGQNNAPLLDPIAWYGGNSGVGYRGRGWSGARPEKQYEFAMAGPRVTGEKQPNAWGLKDMLGNVCEWCRDWSGPLGPEPAQDPEGPATGSVRVDRGGAWSSPAAFCRAAARYSLIPNLGTDYVGIRLAAVEVPASASANEASAKARREQEKALDAHFAGSWPGEARIIEEVSFHWCPPTGPQGFLMGSPADEPGREADETQHSVVLTRGFWLAETELTQAQWQTIMGTDLLTEALRALSDNTPYNLGGKKQTVRDFFGVSSDMVKRRDAGSMIGFESPDLPMYAVNWEEAAEFCRRVTERERTAGRLSAGWRVQLPTEAQWEYASRAGNPAATYAGAIRILGRNNAPVLDPIAWYGGNSGVGYAGKGWAAKWVDQEYDFAVAGPRVVAQKSANAWGLRDMLGNVSEWCGDWYAPYPAGGAQNPEGPPVATFRVLRGGSWAEPARACRAAYRDSLEPQVGLNNAGFRLAIVPSDN